MENLRNDDQSEKLHPKPTDDPGAQIETVIPDSKKESLPNDKDNFSGNNQDKSVTDSDNTEGGEETNLENDDTVSKDPKRYQDKNEGNSTDIETVTP